MTQVLVPNRKFLDGITSFQKDFMIDFDKFVARFFMLNWHRRARKSSLAINLLNRECVRYEKRRYGYITSTYKAAKNIVWRDPNMLKSYLVDSTVKKLNESELYVEYNNGSILSLHGSDDPDSIRGIDFAGVVIDEASYVKPIVWEEILRPIMAQDPKRWALFIFTPAGKNWIYKLWCSVKENKEWARSVLKGSNSGIFSKEEFKKLKLEMTKQTFQQEIESEFNDDASTVFRGIEYCTFGRYAPYVNGTYIEIEKYNPIYTYVTSADLAKTVDYTVIITMCRETKKVTSFQRFNNLDWNFQKEKIISETRKYCSVLTLDATGVGDPILDDLRKFGVKIPEDLAFKFNNTNKKELIQRLIISIEQRLIKIPNIDVLVDELGSFGVEITQGGYIRYTAPDGEHDDTVIALALAVNALKTFLYNSSVSQEVPEQTLITSGAY